MELETFLTTADRIDSREIARVTGKEHRNVLRDIEDQLGQLDGGVSKFEHTYQHEQNGQTYRCFLLPKRERLILASGYNVRLRAAIIDRWAELEAAAMPSVPKTLAEALRLAADQAEALEKAAPAIAFVAAHVDTKMTKAVSDVGKVLGIGPKAFFALMSEKKILFKRGGSWVPYQEHLDAGHFEVKTGTEHGHAWFQTRFTAEGVQWIAGQVQK